MTVKIQYTNVVPFWFNFDFKASQGLLNLE